MMKYHEKSASTMYFINTFFSLKINEEVVVTKIGYQVASLHIILSTWYDWSLLPWEQELTCIKANKVTQLHRKMIYNFMLKIPTCINTIQLWFPSHKLTNFSKVHIFMIWICKQGLYNLYLSFHTTLTEWKYFEFQNVLIYLEMIYRQT